MFEDIGMRCYLMADKEIWTIEDIKKEFEHQGLSGRSKQDFLDNVQKKLDELKKIKNIIKDMSDWNTNHGLTEEQALEYIKNHGVWQFAGIHGWTTPDEKLIKSFETIQKDLEVLDILKSNIIDI